MTEPETQEKPRIKGEPLDLEDLLVLAPVDVEDIASALIFFEDNAPKGAEVLE